MPSDLDGGIRVVYKLSSDSINDLVGKSQIGIIKASVDFCALWTSLIGGEEIVEVQIPVGSIVRSSESHRDSIRIIIINDESKGSLDELRDECHVGDTWGLLARIPAEPALQGVVLAESR